LPVSSTTRSRVWGLLDTQRAQGVKPLSTHLADWQKSLEAKGTAKNAELKYSRVKRVFDACGFRTFGDISAHRVTLAIAGFGKIAKRKRNGAIVLTETDEPISQRTQHHILQACKQFCLWGKADGRTGQNPLEHLKPVQVKETQRRAAFTRDEIGYLLDFVGGAEPRFNMSGHQRALLYRLAVESGLRAGELRHLTAACFDFEARTVTLSGRFTKNGDDAVLPLRADTAELLQGYLLHKLPSAKVFDLPSKSNICKMIHKDPADTRRLWLSQGGDKDNDFLAVDTSKGRRDFHSLRHTFASQLALSGIHPKIAQNLLRHSKADLTLSIYSHIGQAEERAGVEALPDFNCPAASESQKKTGTDGAAVVDAVSQNRQSRFNTCFNNFASEHSETSRCIAKQGDNGTSAKTVDIEPKIGILAGKQGFETKAAVGFEPTDNGFANRRLRPLGYAAKTGINLAPVAGICNEKSISDWFAAVSSL
jgi:integrase/recombinase XerC